MEPLPILRHIEETDCCGYDPDDELGDRAKSVKMFKDVPLIEAAALNEVWPGQWQEAKLQSVERLVVNQTSEKGHDFKPASSGASSLLAMSLEKVILETLLEAPEALPRIFKHIRGFSGFWPALKEKLYSMPYLMTNSKTVGVLLRNVLKNESTIDLSPFDLNGDQLHRIVCNGAKKKSIHILSLSGNQNLREADVKDILNKNKSLQALHLLNTP